MTSTDTAASARERAKVKLGFYQHLAVYFVINLLLFFINQTTSPDYLWSIWPMIGWGVAVVFHALNVYVFGDRGQIVDRLAERERRREEQGRR